MKENSPRVLLWSVWFIVITLLPYVFVPDPVTETGTVKMLAGIPVQLLFWLVITLIYVLSIAILAYEARGRESA